MSTRKRPLTRDGLLRLAESLSLRERLLLQFAMGQPLRFEAIRGLIETASLEERAEAAADVNVLEEAARWLAPSSEHVPPGQAPYNDLPEFLQALGASPPGKVLPLQRAAARGGGEGRGSRRSPRAGP